MHLTLIEMVDIFGAIYWEQIGTWIGVALAFVGVVVGIRSVVSRKVTQHQKGGAHSTNIQAGRDVNGHWKDDK